MERVVVKVQRIPGDEERAIVSDQSRRYVLEVPATEPLRSRMGDKQTAFFVANIMTSAVELLDLVRDQPW